MHFAVPNLQAAYKPGGRLPLLFARPPVIFPADEVSQYLLYCVRRWLFEVEWPWIRYTILIQRIVHFLDIL